MTSILLLLLSVVFIILLTARFKVHPFLALLFAALGFGLLSGMGLADAPRKDGRPPLDG